MRFLLLSIAACMMSYSAQAQTDGDITHLRKENPIELYVDFYEYAHCGWNLEPVVDSELAKAGINRKRTWGYVYDMNIAFGHFTRSETAAEGVFVKMYIEPGDYSTFGAVTNDETGRQHMRDSLQEIKSKALADYRKANGLE